MQASNQKQNQMSLQQELLSKQSRIVRILTVLGIRRQARLAAEDYLVFATDLEPFELIDIEVGLEDLGKQMPGEYETAFPSVGRLIEVVRNAKRRRLKESAKLWEPCGICEDCRNSEISIIGDRYVSIENPAGVRLLRRLKCFTTWLATGGEGGQNL